LGGFVNPKTLLVLLVVALELRWWKFLFLPSSFSVFLYSRIQEFRFWFWVFDRLFLVVVVIFGFAKELLFLKLLLPAALCMEFLSLFLIFVQF
jgi:hypothetical protein